MKALRKVDRWIERHMNAGRWVMVWLLYGILCIIEAVIYPGLFFKAIGAFGAFCAGLLAIRNARRLR